MCVIHKVLYIRYVAFTIVHLFHLEFGQFGWCEQFSELGNCTRGLGYGSCELWCSFLLIWTKS